MIIFLDPRDKLRTPEDIDSLLSAEFPDEEEEPELFDLVKKFMVHTPCGAQNPNAPCMRNGKCSKGFPKPFRDQTTVNGVPKSGSQNCKKPEPNRTKTGS